MTGVFINVLFDVGLRAPAAPGSIFAVYAQTPSGSFFGVTCRCFGAAAVSFLVASFLLKMDRSRGRGDLVAATASMEAHEGQESIASVALAGSAAAGHARPDPLHRVRLRRRHGLLGDGRLGAAQKIQDAGLGDVKVVNKAISNLDRRATTSWSPTRT